MKFSQEMKNGSILLLGSAIQAFGIYQVHSLSQVSEGGVLGATLLIEHWFSISPAVSSFILNCICYFVGYKCLGKKFIIYSVIASFGFSFSYAFFEQFDRLWPSLAQMPLAASLLGALFIGVGAGIAVKTGGATTGDDAVAMSIQSKLGIEVQWVYLFSDTTILLLSLSYIPLRRILYSFLTVILSGQIIGLIQKINKNGISHS